MPLDLVVGASGFIGSHLVDELTGARHAVRVLLRPTSSLRWLPKQDIEVVRMSPWDQDGFASVLRGVDTAYLVAGITHGTTKSTFFDFHSRTTTDMLEAASRAEPGPRRVIIFSSLAAAGPSRDRRSLTESDTPRPVSWYGESKLEQERIALSFKDRQHVTVLRPPAVYGPRDMDLLHFFRILKRGIYPAPGGGMGMQSMTYVSDIIRGTVLAAQADIPSGRVYFVSSHEIVTWKEIARCTTEYFRNSPITIPVPTRIIPLMGLIAQWIASITGTKYPLDRNKAMEGRYLHWICSPARAYHELGFTASIPITTGLPKTLKWYEKHNML